VSNPRTWAQEFPKNVHEDCIKRCKLVLKDRQGGGGVGEKNKKNNGFGANIKKKTQKLI